MSEGSGGGSPFPWGLTPAGSEDAHDEIDPEAVIPERAPSEFLPPVAAAAPAAIPEREPTELLPTAEVPRAVVPSAAVEPVPAPAAPELASAPSTEPESGGAVDALFGDTRFQEFDEGLVPVRSSRDRRPAPRGARVAARPSGLSTTQKRIISVAGVVVAILALVALFFLGTRLPALLSASRATATSSPSPTRTATPTPTPTVVPVGPVAAGVHGWNELRGGECLDPYTSPWAEKFTVVDCAVAHPSQMVFRGTFDPATTPTFPGAPALQTQISLLCAAPGVLDLAAAGEYADAQVQGSYPVTQEEWTAGQHDYFCFVSRSSGQPLTGSVAVVKPAAPAPAP